MKHHKTDVICNIFPKKKKKKQNNRLNYFVYLIFFKRKRFTDKYKYLDVRKFE